MTHLRSHFLSELLFGGDTLLMHYLHKLARMSWQSNCTRGSHVRHTCISTSNDIL